MICVFISDSNISLRSNVGSKTQGIIETSIKEFHMNIPTSLQSGKYDDQRVTSQIIIILLSSLILFFRYVSIGIWRSYVSRNGPCATNISNPISPKIEGWNGGSYAVIYCKFRAGSMSIYVRISRLQNRLKG
jgi:hypothetical protein